MYSLRSIIFFANIDVSTYISVIDTSVLANRVICVRGSIRKNISIFMIPNAYNIKIYFISSKY
jgi:hypothetical protein